MRYVIVSVVKGPAGNFNNNLRKEVFEKLGAKSSKLPAHFTIKAPFEADDISDLDKVLQDFAQNHKAQDYKIKGYNHFDNRVVYMDVHMSKECKNLHDELIEELKNTNEEWIIVGEAVYKYEDKIKDISNIHVPAPSHNVSKASSLCSIAIEKYNNNIDVYDCYSINPLYIRKSQAEVQYDEKMKRLNDGK